MNWLHQLSKGEVRTRYLTSNKAGYTLQTSTYQMGVLLQFNNEDQTEMTAEDIQIATQLTDASLRTTLLVLLFVGFVDLTCLIILQLWLWLWSV